MRPGKVVQIRVNPKDCMSVVDLLRGGGVEVEKMTFSAAVSLALSSLLLAARGRQQIPDRDGFEYSEMMQPFESYSGRSDKNKRALSEKINKGEIKAVELLGAVGGNREASELEINELLALDKKRKQVQLEVGELERYKELEQKVYG